MIETVTITPTARGEVPGIIVCGQLGSILGLDGMSGLHVGGAGWCRVRGLNSRPTVTKPLLYR